MNVVIRPGSPEDAKAIMRIATASFGHEFDCARVHHVLQSRRNHTLVAEYAGKIVGFADNFLGRSPLDKLRLELDLLAVDEAARGLGIGTSLVQNSSLLADALNVDLARALVRSENLAMQGLMRRCGYRQSPHRYHLHVSSDIVSEGVTSSAHDGHLIIVDTMAYRGIWIEGHLNQDAIRAAKEQAVESDLQTIGVVLDAKESAAQSLLAACGFSNVGAYHWWTFIPRIGQS